MSTVWCHTRQYLADKKAGRIEVRDGRRYLPDGNEVIVNDGVPAQEGYHGQPAEREVRKDGGGGCL